MSSLIAAAVFSSCLNYAEWVGYYYRLRTQQTLEIPKSWMLEGIPRMKPAIDRAYKMPRGKTRAWVEIVAEDECQEDKQ